MEKNSLHILVVDDDDGIRNLLKDYLSKNDYMVSTAENAQKAKSKIVIGIEKSGSKPNKDQSQNDENIDNIKCSP